MTNSAYCLVSNVGLVHIGSTGGFRQELDTMKTSVQISVATQQIFAEVSSLKNTCKTQICKWTLLF